MAQREARVRSDFNSALAAVLLSEGGYVCDPQDPGGATNRGITQAVYDDWRQNRNLEKQDVKLLSPAETCAIYKKLYWDAVSGDELPSGVDYCTFDFAVNSGVARAVRYLQRAAGVAPDGQIGPVTLSAVSSQSPKDIIGKMCVARLNFLRQLPTYDHFGNGWTRRVEEVAVRAKAMAT
jgi:lysozyme family protein